MASSFLDKVYDVYENDDFSYGQDNLNPTREIKPVGRFKTDEDRAKEIIAARIAKLKTELNNIGVLDDAVDDDEINLSLGGENVSSDKSSKEIASFLAAGTNVDEDNIFGDALDTDYDKDNGIGVLTREIDNLIAEIIARLVGMGLEIPDYLDKTSMSIFNIDCNGIAEEISGLESNNGDGNLDNANADDGDGSGDGDGDDDEDEDNDNDDDGGGDDNDDVDGDDVFGFNDAFDRYEQEQDAADAAFDISAAQCALKELAFLKIILTILKVISILKKVVSYALNIAYTVIDIVQLAAGAWLNPTNIGKIAQRIMGRVMAIMQQVMSMLLQMIWDMLNMDCISSAALSLIDQINQALAGVLAIKAECNPSSVTTQIKGLKDKFNKAKEEVEAALERTKALNPFSEENRAKFKEEAKALFEDAKNQAKDAALGSLKGSKFGQLANTLKEQAKTTVGLTSQMPGGQSAVNRLAALPGFSLLES